jgi:hypothetical protein
VIFKRILQKLLVAMNAGQNQDIKIPNRPFENVSQFKYLGRTVTNYNCIQRKLRD